MTVTAQRSRLLWLVALDESDEARQTLEEDLPSDVRLQPVSLDGDWTGPPRHRAFGVVVLARSGGADQVAGALNRIKRRSVLPILVLIDGVATEQQHTLMRAGATAVLKPPMGSESARTRVRLRLHRTLELMEEAAAKAVTVEADLSTIKLIAIGSSTGGPEALKQVLCGGKPFRVPVLIAQHVTRNFDKSLAEWLTEMGQPCRVCQDGDRPEPGLALLAPATEDMVLRDGVCHLQPPHATNVPSADALLSSVAKEIGRRAVGLVLTGMGSDGAVGLLALQQAGGFTITQRGDTCVVDGMPKSARELHAQCADWTPSEIRAYLDQLRVS